MTVKELVDAIIKRMASMGYVVKAIPLFGGKAFINTKYKICAYDLTNTTPFDFAHEYIHAKYEDHDRKCEYDITNYQEVRANREAILFLWDIFESQGGSYHDISVFCEFTGCPFYLSCSIISEITNDVIEFLNEEDSRTIEECAEEYLNDFDFISDTTIINIESFLKRYGINFNQFDKARNILFSKANLKRV